MQPYRAMLVRRGVEQSSFNVPPKLWAAFKAQTDGLFLSRAPFLDYMVANELPHLRTELDGLNLSLRAKRYIAGAMKKQGPISVNIEVRPETAEALREAAQAHNLVRDAFMARLLIFLRSTDAFLKYLEVPRIATSRGTNASLEEMPASPLKAMEAVRDDPLFYVRFHVEAVHDGWHLQGAAASPAGLGCLLLRGRGHPRHRCLSTSAEVGQRAASHAGRHPCKKPDQDPEDQKVKHAPIHTSNPHRADRIWLLLGGRIEPVRATGEKRYLHEQFAHPLRTNGRRNDVPAKLLSRLNQLLKMRAANDPRW